MKFTIVAVALAAAVPAIATGSGSYDSASAVMPTSSTKTTPKGTVMPVIAGSNSTRPASNGTSSGTGTHTSSTPAIYTGGADSLTTGTWMGFAAIVGLLAL